MTLPVSVIIPAWNEADNLKTVLGEMPVVEQLIIVDANSQDGTVEIVTGFYPNAVIISQKPTGKGNAILAGMKVATSDYIVCMDADGSMDPRQISEFVNALESGFDVVKGSREMVGGRSEDFTMLRRAGNLFLTAFCNILFGTLLTDITYGFIGFRRNTISRLGLCATGFEIEVEAVVNALRNGLRFTEIPSIEASRLSGVSNLHPWRDGNRILKTIFMARFGFVKQPMVPAYDVVDTAAPVV